MKHLKKNIKKLLPLSVLEFARVIIVKINCVILRFQHKNTIKKLQNRDSVNVVFFVFFESVWKVDYLYRLMALDNRFNPTILVCPVVNKGYHYMIEQMNSCYNYFNNLGYNVIKSYDMDADRYLDVRHTISPDVIFYTNPYQSLIDSRYYIDKFKDILTCYVPYYYGEGAQGEFVNHKLHNECWKFFVESDFHYSFCKRHMYNNAKNVLVTGYPGVDAFLDDNYIPNDVWKIKNKKIKRLIWAPHHSINESASLSYSCFLYYYQYMLDVARHYKNEIQVAFKPHPLLKNNLYSYWGKDKTDEYYNKWANGENTFLVEGNYVDLFLTSDAMIHDSGSFLIEYLYVNKPVMRTDNNRPLEQQFNDFAIECLKYYYHAHDTNDISNFVMLLINDEDPLKEKRTKFCNEVLNKNETIPSVKIYTYLKSIFKN